MHRRAEDRSRGLCLAAPRHGNRRGELVEQQCTGSGILDPGQQLAQHAEARRHDAARRPRVHAFGQNIGTQRRHQVSAQRSGAPQLIVVAAFGVKADDQTRRPDPVAKRGNVVFEVAAAAFLARLDQDHAARMRCALRLQRADGGE